MICRKELEAMQAAGKSYVQVIVNQKKYPRVDQKVRVMPGVYGICIGRLDVPGTWLVDVAIADLLEALPARSEGEKT